MNQRWKATKLHTGSNRIVKSTDRFSNNWATLKTVWSWTEI